jgi:CBS domain-containing protein
VNIRKLMSRNVATCAQSDTLHTVAGLMWERDCGIVPVVDEQKKVVGVVTDRDLCMAAWSKDRRLLEIPVSDVMSRHVQTCQEHDSIEAVMTLMRTQRVRRLPIVDREGHLTGVVSLNDIVRAVCAEKDSTRRTIESEEVVHALAGICEARHLPGAVSKPGPAVSV